MDDSFSYSFIGDKNAKICLEIGSYFVFLVLRLASEGIKIHILLFHYILAWDFIDASPPVDGHALAQVRKSVTASGKFFNNR